jgi:hypothetical protein
MFTYVVGLFCELNDLIEQEPLLATWVHYVPWLSKGFVFVFFEGSKGFVG